MTKLTRAQRLIVGVYFILLAYCCAWVPWLYLHDGQMKFIGYRALWQQTPAAPMTPDVTVIVLRIAALSAVAVAVIFLTTLVKR